jgi:hypothetical protein
MQIKVEASIPYMIIIDIGRKNPCSFITGIETKIGFDAAYIQKNNESQLELIRE